MSTFEPKVFISCHPKDKEGEFYGDLFRSLNDERGLDVVDDTRGMGYKDSIREFIERVGRAACVVVVLSDRYLRDGKCILQLVEVAKNEQFRERIFQITLGKTEILDKPEKRLKYVKYWETKRTELAKELRSIDPANLQGLREDMDNLDAFRDRISGILDSLADMRTLPLERLRENNFEALYQAIDGQLKVVQAEALSHDPEDARLREWSGGSPYPGLLNFEIEDASIFFGRWVETEALIRRLENPDCHFLAVVGASGSGKSSLVKAGLLARLKEGNAGKLKATKDWPVLKLKPGEDEDGPFKTLANELEPILREKAQATRRKLEETPGFLREALENTLAKGPETRRVILFIDQFEELFTLVGAGLREKFLLMLKDATGSERVLTVVTMRSDFFRLCDESDILRDLINVNANSTYPLGVPGPLEMYKMIVKPARAAGLLFEPGLDRRILDDTGHDPGALALMAFALKLLYDASGNSRLMTKKTYDKFGGVKGAIGAVAMETFDAEKFADLPKDAQDAFPRVFRELLDVDESGTTTRKRVKLGDVKRDDSSSAFVDKLIEKRLLVSSSKDKDGLVEVAHEALFSSWPILAEWIRDTKDARILRRQVRTAAELWDKKGRKPEFLWPDERLKPVYEMQKLLEPTWESYEKEFIRPEADRLLDEIEIPTTTHQRRSEIGERLARIGDPRPGVGLVESILPLKAREISEGGRYAFDELKPGEIRLWGDKPEHEGLPDIVWLLVEGGSVQIYENTFAILPFLVAKYPITYKQFQVFIDVSDGFRDPRWWQGLSVDEDNKSKPGEQKFKFDNHPRETVSWYGAVAFCRWLNARLSWSDIPIDLSLETLGDYQGIRLPTEWEWQWVATGGQPDYEYPWGSEWDGRKANTFESGLGRTTAVGMYIAGSAKCGALDLCHNVSEWCLNTAENLENIGLDSEDRRTVRGGSWSDRQDSTGVFTRSERYSFHPPTASLGFRIVVRHSSL